MTPDKDKSSPPNFPSSIPEKSLGLYVKLALMAAAVVLITAVALVLIAVWQSSQYSKLAQREVDFLINSDLDHITQGVYNLVRTENEAVQEQVAYNLNVARHILDGTGDVRLAEETVNWTAFNQFTKESEKISLPKLIVGDAWLEKNRRFDKRTMIVDEVSRLVGETATIFQRMNKRGDMLRVATNIATLDKKRAIGTYIPAVHPEGTEDPVISTILKGKIYHGRAYVVNAWYITAYAPLNDKAGRLVGMIYVGVKQKAVEARVRYAILQTKVGKTGYVYVLGGGGEDRGKYIISYKGERDGEDIWSVRDSEGRYVIRDIINQATTLKPGEMTTVRYQWQNPGEEKSRLKIARLAYYEPWDWVIGTSVYEDELQTYRTLLSDGQLRMTRMLGLAGIVITLLVGITGIFITWRITRPVHQMTQVAEKIIHGDLDQEVVVKSHDEIGVLARTFNLMTTQLKKSMEELKESEENYRGIFENAIEGLFRNTINGQVSSANPAMARMLGYASPEEYKSSIHDVGKQVYVNPEDRDRLFAILSSQGNAKGFEVELFKKDKKKIWVSISARITNHENGQPGFIEGFVTDISERKSAAEERKRLRNQLVQAQKMEAIGTLAGGIAHDFNNILSAIIGYTELVMDDIPESENVQGDLKEVLKAGIRAKDLVNQILAFGRMSEIEYAPIALCTIIKESLKMLRAAIPSNIEIRQDLAVSGLVLSDPTQINQIIMNLCTNAVHAMDETGGILEVSLKETTINSGAASGLGISPGPYFELTVRDNGKGMQPEIIDRIFEPYFTTKEKGQGTGLGLSVIHGIVRNHSGTITCKSVLDVGTTFTVYLPRIQSESKDIEPVLHRTLPTGTERILFVDDEPVLTAMAEKMLAARGYQVVSSSNSSDALDMFRRDPYAFDLVITDMTMPGMTGDRLAQELLLIRQDIPVILCTGYNARISEDRAKEIGIREFILKPLDIQTLLETVRKVLD